MEEKLKITPDILTEADVSVLVNAFYAKVREDVLLGNIFNHVIKDNWPAHLNRMIDFWSTVLLYTRTYKDDPMPKHLQLLVGKEHFDRWLALFDETISEHFDGQIAENARKRAASIASIMQAVNGIPK